MAAFSHIFDPRRFGGIFRRNSARHSTVDNGAASIDVSPEPDASKPRVGIAFSAGGAKGLAHIGVIQVLEENGFEVAAIAGTSMGAYVSALWAAGVTGGEFERLASNIATSRDRMALVDPVFPPRRGFICGKKIEARLRETLGHKTFADLKTPAYLVATEMNSFARYVLDEGDVASAVMASLAVPGIVVPIKREGREFVDGGIADPLPVSVLKELAEVDKIIAVSVIPSVDEVVLEAGSLGEACAAEIPLWKKPLCWLNRNFNYFAKGNLLDILRGAAMGSQMRLVEHSADEADLFIRAVNPSAQWHDYHNYKIYIELGRKAAETVLPELNELFEIKKINAGKESASP